MLEKLLIVGYSFLLFLLFNVSQNSDGIFLLMRLCHLAQLLHPIPHLDLTGLSPLSEIWLRINVAPTMQQLQSHFFQVSAPPCMETNLELQTCEFV